MSTIRVSSAVTLAIALVGMLVPGGVALAAKAGHSSASYGGGYGSGGGGRQEMMLDFSTHYVRDTKPDGDTDTAGRFSLGGMFNEWMGLDLQGLLELRSKSYLVGADFRFVPTEWLFLKVGMGGYADKQTRDFRVTGLGGAGIMARISRDYYFVTETSYFSVDDRNNISFGVGLGMLF